MKSLKTFSAVIFFIALTTGVLISQPKNSPNLWCMEFVDDQTGITVGDEGIIKFTSDGGTTWTVKESGTTNSLKKTAILTDDAIVVVGLGGTVVKTTDHGNSWATMSSNTTADLYGVSFGGRDNETGIAVGTNETILRSTDQGLTWTQMNATNTSRKSVHYRSVSFASADNGIVVGDNGLILLSNDGGLSWRFSSSVLPPYNYKFVTMLTDDLAYATGDNGAVIKTTDGGETWETSNTGISNTLYRVRFADDQTAISVGTDGTVLKTTDGGDTWNTQSSGSTNDLNCLFVADENIAYTGGEDGVILKSTDGGVTWVSQGDAPVRNSVTGDKDNKGTISNYPNPSNPVTTIRYYVPNAAIVSLDVFDASGRLVKSLVNESQSQGMHSVEFNGAGLASGVYFCKFVAADMNGITANTLKIVLAK